MLVTLMSHTPDALNLLLRTKNTRLDHDSDPAEWTEDEKQVHLHYMLKTIKSSWEFVDYTFKIEGVTRAFTHQLVRTRAGSYAQESQRTVRVEGGRDVLGPRGASDLQHAAWNNVVGGILDDYQSLIDDYHLPVQDARGVLPTNITTSIIAKLSLRTLHEMAKVRLCRRTQGEYQRVFRAMREAVVSVHPWSALFIQVACVADGVCAFPMYGEKECDVYDPAMDQDRVKVKAHRAFWSSDIKEAVPVAKDGRTM